VRLRKGKTDGKRLLPGRSGGKKEERLHYDGLKETDRSRGNVAKKKSPEPFRTPKGDTACTKNEKDRSRKKHY